MKLAVAVGFREKKEKWRRSNGRHSMGNVLFSGGRLWEQRFLG